MPSPGRSLVKANAAWRPASAPTPASPNQNGKVERFHGTFRPDFLDLAGPFTSVPQAQAAVDAWVEEYNTDRPHQALDEKVPVTPAERFTPVPVQQRDLIRRQPDASDRRVHLLSLTPAGDRLRRSAEAAIRASEEEVLATLPAGDREAFLRSLKSLYECYRVSAS